MLKRIPYDGCPLCSAREVKSTQTADCSRHPLYSPAISPEMLWLECASCGHFHTDGYHSSEALQMILRNTPDNQNVGFDIEQQRRVSARMIEKILPHADAGSWLDIGFGNASLLFTAEEFGFFPVGIDLRRDNVETVKRLGLEAHSVELSHFIHPSRFRVVSMCDVLEHIPYPVESLRLVHDLLTSDGVLFISTPNADSMIWRISQGLNSNPYMSELEHYHNFGKWRLYRLLRDNGFEPIRYGISERYSSCMEVVALKVVRTNSFVAAESLAL